MRRWTRGWKTFCLTLMVLTSFCMGVGVSQGLEAREVTAQLRPDFVIVIDQETAHFSDVNGSEVYPLLYEGTTYLPLRAIGNLMGKQVDWDEQSKTVTLSDALRESVGVERVVDGDTLEVLWRGNLEKVRLIGVDTAESAHPDEQKNTEFGRLAAAYTKEALEGKTVELEFDVQQRDQYGRLLCYVVAALGGRVGLPFLVRFWLGGLRARRESGRPGGPGGGPHPFCLVAGVPQGAPPFPTRLCLQSVVCYTCWRG